MVLAVQVTFFFSYFFSRLLSAGKKLNVAVTPAASEPRLPHTKMEPCIEQKKKKKETVYWRAKKVVDVLRISECMSADEKKGVLIIKRC